ncbi:peptidoglycan recognition family protein [Embleya sp. NPDC059237]|uniref:peptidoglycan recognition protein family protein n=1 Tax=Embleya sp. NPDC059237 TaxID=3346784 RepID=UPI0036ABE767
MQLVNRVQWGARPYLRPNGATPYAHARAGVKIHYLGTRYEFGPHEGCAAYVRKLQASHMDGNGWSDIGYSFVVCEHGAVHEGRGLSRRNSANGTTSLNENHYAICALVGSEGSTEPTEAQLHGLRDAIEYCRAQGPAGSEIAGHRDGYSTDCPGGPLYAWVRRGAPRPGSPAPGGGTPTGGRSVSLSQVLKAAGEDPPGPDGHTTFRDAVRLVEDALATEGLLDPRYVDGSYGTKTIAAYGRWQEECGFTGPDADGRPGVTSLSRLGAKYGFTVTP